MSTAKNGDTVRVHYTGTLEDGKVFDTSSEREPLEFELGSGNVISGFDRGVSGMEVGEKKSITIPCDEAYGEHDDSMLIKVERTQLPDDIKPEAGMMLSMTTQQEQPVPVRITEVTEENITVDANHPLAGKDLKFELELVEIL